MNNIYYSENDHKICVLRAYDGNLHSLAILGNITTWAGCFTQLPINYFKV